MNFQQFQRLQSIMKGQQTQQQAGPQMSAPALFASEHTAPGQTMINTPLFPVPGPANPVPVAPAPAGPVLGPAMPGVVNFQPASGAGFTPFPQPGQAVGMVGSVPVDANGIPIVTGPYGATADILAAGNPNPAGSFSIDPQALIHNIGNLVTNPSDLALNTYRGAVQGGQSVWGGLKHPLGAAKEGVTTLMNEADKPRQYNTALIGRAIYDASQGNLTAYDLNPTVGLEEATGAATATFDKLLATALGQEGEDEQSLYTFAGDPKNQAAIQDAYTKGYDVKDAKGKVIKHFDPGYQAVWELYQGQRGLISRGTSALVTDPMSYLPVASALGRATEGSAIARELALAGQLPEGTELPKSIAVTKAVGRVLQAPDKAFELPFWAGGKSVGFAGRVAERAGEARGISRVAGPVGEYVGRELGPTDAATRQAFEQEREIAYFNHRRAQQDAKAMGIPVKDEDVTPTVPQRVPGEASQDYVTLTGRGNETIYQGSTPRTVLPEAAPVGAPQAATDATMPTYPNPLYEPPDPNAPPLSTQIPPRPTLTPVKPAAAIHDVRQSASGKWQVIGPDGKVRGTYGTEAKATAKAVQLDAEAAPKYTTKRVNQNEVNVVNPDGEVVGSVTGDRAGPRAGLVVDDLNSGKSPRESIITRPAEQAATAVAEAPATVPTAATPGVGLSAEITQDVTPPPNPRAGWSLQGALFDELQATDPEAATRIIARLQPDAAAFEAKMNSGISKVDQVVEEGRYATRIRQAITDEGITPAEWQLRFQEHTNSPQAQVERILHMGDEASTKGDRNALYSLGTLQKKPPREGLAEDIVNGTLPRNKITIDGTTYRNTDLLRMPPEKRQSLANLAVTEQQRAYQRYVDIGQVRQDLHGAPQAAEQVPPQIADVAPSDQAATVTFSEPRMTPNVSTGGSREQIIVRTSGPQTGGDIRIWRNPKSKTWTVEQKGYYSPEGLGRGRSFGTWMRQDGLTLDEAKAVATDVANTPLEELPFKYPESSPMHAEPGTPATTVWPEKPPLSTTPPSPESLGPLRPATTEDVQASAARPVQRPQLATPIDPSRDLPGEIADVQAEISDLESAIDLPGTTGTQRQDIQREIKGAKAELRRLQKLSVQQTTRSPEALGITALTPEQQQGAQFGRDALLGRREASTAVAPPEPGELSGMEAWGGISPEERQLLSEQVPHEGEVKPLFKALDDVILKNTPENATREDEHAVVRAFLASVNPHATKAERTVMDRVVKAYDTFSQVQRQNIQYNIVNGLRGSLGDMIGDSYTTMISHGLTPAPKYLYPRGVKRFLAHQRGQGDEALLQLKDARVYSDLGLDSPGHEVISVHGRVDPKHDQMTLRQGAQKIGFKGRTSGSIIGIFQNKFMRDLRVALDQHKRLVLKTSVIRDELNPAKLRFLHYLEDHADRLGINPGETYRAIEETATARIAAQAKEEKAIFTGYQGAFSPADVKVATGKEELARVWKGEVNQLNATGREAVNRTLFSYKGTKVDQQLGRLLFFHYWQSRALLLHTRLTLENPWLLAAYGRTWNYLQTQADKEGYPDSIRGYLGYMADNNYIGAINPLGIILPSLMYSDLGGQNGQGRDWERFAGKFGLFINPVLQSAASAIGWGSRANDPSSTYAVRNMVRSVLDYDRNHGNLFHLGPGMTGDVVQQFTNKVMQMTSGLATAAHLPFADKLQDTDPHATDIGQINNIIQTLAEQQYGPSSTWSKDDEAWSAVVEAQNAVAQGKTEGNALAESAMDAWSKASIEQRGWAAAIPGGVRKVYAPQEERRQLRNQGYSAKDQGLTPTDESQAAITADQFATASPEARTLGLQQNQYGALGTDQQQFLADRWNAIAFGSLQPGESVMITNGKMPGRYNNDQLLALTADERKALADQYVTNYAASTTESLTGSPGSMLHPYGLAPKQLEDLRTQQKTFKEDAANTDYAAYSDWRSSAYGYKGGVEQFRKDMSRISPGYRAYINSQPADISPTELNQKAVSPDAYLASKGEKSSIYQGSTPNALDPTAIDPSTILFGSGGSDSGASGGGRSGTGGWTEKSVTKSLTDYKVKSDQYNQAVMSVTNGVPLDQLMPMFQDVAIKKLQDMGIRKPGKPGIVSSYELWVASLPQGSDSSVAAFVKWYNDQTQAALAQYTPSVTATASP